MSVRVTGNNASRGGESVVMDGRWGVVVKILSNVRGAKAPSCSTSVTCRKSPAIAISLTTPLEAVQNLQKTLQEKAK
ncbi:hypothetical protein AWP60_04685 [Escherichia coli]|nr:hypothetical protein AWP60_04685 [Escherichia coli]